MRIQTEVIVAKVAGYFERIRTTSPASYSVLFVDLAKRAGEGEPLAKRVLEALEAENEKTPAKAS